MKPIKSSEIASYVFCPVSWWKGVNEGVKITPAITKGVEHHSVIAENESSAKFLYVAMVVVGVVFLLVILYMLII